MTNFAQELKKQWLEIATKYEDTSMNLPEWLIKLGEDIFYHLPKEQAKLFPVALIGAIPNNKNIENVRKRFILRLLTDKVHGCMALTGDKPDEKDFVARCVELCKNFSSKEYFLLQDIHSDMKKTNITNAAAFLLAERYMYQGHNRERDESAIRAIQIAVKEKDEEKDLYNYFIPTFYPRMRDIIIEELTR